MWFHDFIFRLKNRGKDFYVLSISESKFTLKKNGLVTKEFEWKNVSRIYAKNFDDITVDVFAFVFKLDDGSFVTVSENYSNFEELEKALDKQFPNLNQTAIKDIYNSKPFQELKALIWER